MIIALWSVIVLLAVAIWACICSNSNYQDRIVSLEYRMEGMVHKTDNQAKQIEELERLVWKQGYDVYNAVEDVADIKRMFKKGKKK
jgi:hypothetical protein